MQEALKKNRFYMLHMIKIIFPKLYYSVTKSKVNYFLSLILKNSSHPNAILSSTFLPDLMKYACERKEQYGYLHVWYVFYDRQRQFWPFYESPKSSQFLNIVNVVLRNCCQINLFEAAMKGGNILPVVKTGVIKSAHFDIQDVFRIAPCIITKSKYLTPQLDFTSENKYSVKQDIKLYSHPFLLQYLMFHNNMSYSNLFHCSENKAELSGYHILAANGFWSLYIKSKNKESWKCKNRYLITPIQLAYFFNHSLPYQEYINIKQFRKIHFSALLL